jgi:hypothetical protein
MKSSRLASIAWILGAIAAGFLGAFLWGYSELPEDVAGGQLLVGGALLAAGTGILGLLRPTTMLARWSVVLAVALVVVSGVRAPMFMFESDSVVFGWLPAVLPAVAGLLSLPGATRRGPD